MIQNSPQPTHDPPPAIELRQASRSFGDQHVLRDVSLKIKQGETIVLIGESGCGKSVTMKLMMTLLEPSSGAVHWMGKPVKEYSCDEFREQRLRFGYLFQGAALFDSLNIFENVAFGLRQNRNMSEAEIGQNVIERIREVGLQDSVCLQMPVELSGGMKKRVGLARALALMPDVIFYDEPTTGLDPVMSDVINELILQIRARRPVTSIIVTHDMRTVQKVADRVIMFYPLTRLQPDQSQIVFEGTSFDAFNNDDPRVYQFVKGQAGERIQEIAV